MCPWFHRRPVALPKHHGGCPQSQWLPFTPGGQGQAPKKIPETEAIFTNLSQKDGKGREDTQRLSIDCKAIVNIGEYNSIERCWGVLEQHWNGTLLVNTHTLLEWAKTMTWKGLNPIVKLSQKAYQKGISLTKQAMREIEARLQRNPRLPKWDIFIQPLSGV